jgi:DNA-binding response OmpR family regulator
MSKILIVDDSELNVDLLEQSLEMMGHDTVSAYDGQEALEKVAEEAPDLILLDVMMPIMDGFEVCERVKNNPETQLTPIIIMTALGDVDDRVRGIEAGADDFLTKPVNNRELEARIETALRLKEAMESKIAKAGQLGKHYAAFVPDMVKRRIDENPDQPELEKRDEDATVLFVDIVGYTKLSTSMSADALNALTERYFSVFMDLVHDAGGDIAQSSGDGLMILFQHEDAGTHACRAVKAALALMDETVRLNESGDNQPLQMHMGINSGLASVGSTRYEGKKSSRWVFTADGLMPNLASRLADLANADQILLGPETVARVKDHFDLDDHGCHEMKNIGAPVQVHLVRGPKAAD